MEYILEGDIGFIDDIWWILLWLWLRYIGFELMLTHKYNNFIKKMKRIKIKNVGYSFGRR